MEPCSRRTPTARARRSTLLDARTATLLRRVARRHSLCAEDADDALQRASLILLTKAPPIDPGRLIALDGRSSPSTRRWRCAAAASGCSRCSPRRTAATAASTASRSDAPGPRPSGSSGAERWPRRAPLAALKANERLAIVLQAQGYSYAEICELCGWTYTKVNRCLAEGRAALRGARSSPAGGGSSSSLTPGANGAQRGSARWLRSASRAPG